ncbi:MAG: PucR family transcriptional regulator [Actinomycetes bacterium]
MQPTLSDVLALPVVESGRPLVLAGTEHLDRPVRWVHVGEVPDLASLLHGGELVLTTGVALPESSRELAAYVRDLAEAGACGLVIELGRRFAQVPASIVATGRQHGLPVIALRRTVRFVSVTETVHALIVDAQHEALQLSERAHREFTRLSVAGASVQQILDLLAELAGVPVVLEDPSHRVVAYAADPAQVADLLEGWEARSRLAGPTSSTDLVGPEGWLVTPAGPPHESWGRLVLPLASDDARLRMLVERAADALAINRLLERDRAGLVQQAHRGLLTDLTSSAAPDARGLRARVEGLGLPTARQTFVGVAVHSPPAAPLEPIAAQERDRSLHAAVVAACTQAGLAAVGSPLRPGQVLLLAAVPAGRSTDRAIERFAAALRTRLAVSDWADEYAVGVGGETSRLEDAGACLREAGRVAEQGVALRATRPRDVYRSRDVRLRGLVALLGGDPRVLAFAEAELGPLLAHDAERGSDLVGTLAQYLASGGDKTAAARAANLSRPTLYARLSTIERVLGVSLDDPDSALALRVALLVREVTGSGAGR